MKTEDGRHYYPLINQNISKVHKRCKLFTSTVLIYIRMYDNLNENICNLNIYII